MTVRSRQPARSQQLVTLYQALGNTYLIFDPQINLCGSTNSVELSKD
jgi:hypothetical protein